jgi:(1->4)-alpha-D-glucan 1-alpha-D-glucosylmutase
MPASMLSTGRRAIQRASTVNDLICLRTEWDEVFDHIHSLIFDLVEKGAVTGLRIDHIDGLNDPVKYLRRVRGRMMDGYLVAEKILFPGEHIPEGWPLQGTTGYDFLNCVNGVLCDLGRKDEFEVIYTRFTGISKSYDDVVYEKKRLIADRHMSGEVDNLALLFKRSIGKDRHGRDITFQGVKKALAELLVLFPVYRTYVDLEGFGEMDQAQIAEAARVAKERNLDLFNEIDFVERYLLEPGGEGWHSAIMRLPQFTGPLMAKGYEDTALYVYCRLLSQSEVGADPGSFGQSLDEFHGFNEIRGEMWPYSMNATSTHDTKRGEDARSRINVLSEMPEEWERHIGLWADLNAGLKKMAGGRDMPDRNDENLLYQALIGSVPFSFETDFRKRARSYLVKVVREAKVHSGWVRPGTSYEESSVAFLDGILDSSEFLGSLMPFQRSISHFGILNSIAQTIVKITAPGVPDFYQGTELWDFSFGDPDNRRPVDFDPRISYLKDIAEKEKSDIMGLLAELLEAREDGRIKLFLIRRLLEVRKKNADLFSEGEYIRLNAEGMHKNNVIAFERRHKGSWAMTIAPRLTTALVKDGEMPIGKGVWGDTRLVPADNIPAYWRDAITGRPLRVDGKVYLGDVLEHFPAALLIGREE